MEWEDWLGVLRAALTDVTRMAEYEAELRRAKADVALTRAWNRSSALSANARAAGRQGAAGTRLWLHHMVERPDVPPEYAGAPDDWAMVKHHLARHLQLLGGPLRIKRR